MLDAAETSVDIGITRLKPIAERSPQHACGGSRRSAFHDVMPVIEEVRRIALVEREGLESIKGCKHGACPFPAVTQQIGNSKSAAAGGEGSSRSRIPIVRVEVAEV